MTSSIPTKEVLQGLVRTAVQTYAAGFEARHAGELVNPDGAINMKIHNVFIAALGPEIQYYTALVRSLDSSLGNMLEKLAISIAKLFYNVKQHVEGPLSVEQTRGIAEILERYKRNDKKPQVSDYAFLRTLPTIESSITKRHDSDYYLTDRETGEHYLIELKIGGDLDNKKARSEKEALLEQFAILSNVVNPHETITVYFATAYNRFGEDNPWTQGRVRQFFAPEELLIGRDFWNFICKSDQGYQVVLEAYRENAHYIKDALDAIKRLYLP